MAQQEFEFPASMEDTEKQRLNRHCLAILDALRRGPVTNAAMAEISLNHTARISDLRRHGYVIRCHRGKGGLNTYTLHETVDQS